MTSCPVLHFLPGTSMFFLEHHSLSVTLEEKERERERENERMNIYVYQELTFKCMG